MNNCVETQKMIDEVWEYLVESQIVSEEALQLITGINGYSMKTLNEVIYCLTGYRNIEQLLESE